MKLQKKQFKWTGLFVAVILPVLMSTSALWRDPKEITPSLTGSAIFCLPLLILILILKFGEKEPFTSLGKLAVNFKTIGLSLLLVIIMLTGTFLFGYVMQLLHISPGQEPMYNKMKLLPLWGKILLVLWAGISEEFYFRGYAITRLQELTGSKILAAFLPLLIFGLGHAGDKSLYHVLFATFIGLILTLSYLKTRNLLANMIAHTSLDFIFLVVLS